MPKKEVVPEITTDPTAPTTEATHATEITSTAEAEVASGESPPQTTASEPVLIECIPLHGRLTHDDKTYEPHQRVWLPADVALGLIASGHVAKAE